MAYHECDCPYHCDDYGCMAPGECPNEGTIKVPGYGWLCPQCYDEIDGALTAIDYDDLAVLDAEGNPVVPGRHSEGGEADRPDVSKRCSTQLGSKVETGEIRSRREAPPEETRVLGESMATEAVTAPELAALVKPVRALLTKNKKIGAIKLVRERTECGLKECKEFVEHVQAWPAARAEKVAELWVGITSGEAAADKAESEPQPAASSMEQSIEAPESADAQGVSLADWYARYMQTHTYAEWEQLVEKCIAAEKTEEETAFPTDGITGSKMGSGQCSARTDTLIQSAKPHEEEL